MEKVMPGEFIDGIIKEIQQDENSYKLTLMIPKVKFNQESYTFGKNVDIKTTKEFKAFEEEYYRQMAKICTGRIKFSYTDK